MKITYNSANLEKSPAVKITPRPRGLTVKHIGYATIICEFEWQITILMTTRQDGKTHWTVCLTSIDGSTQVEQGLTPYGDADKAIETAMNKLTVARGWHEPINA